MKFVSFKSLAACSLLISSAVLADYRDDVGYRTLEDHGQLFSKGANLKVGQVEAKIDLGFHPNASDPQFLGKDFLCSPPGDSSVHATTVGTMMYGDEGGLAPGVGSICIMDSDSFLGSRGLKMGKNKPPAKLGVSVLNNSWIASYTVDQYNIEAVRRLDWMIQRDDMLAINSVDNGAGSPFPKLLASSFNGMAVGIMEGSSGGAINFDSRGTRVKPDLVVSLPQVPQTSYATAVVSGAAALIRSEAKARQMNVSELTTKAILMAGAQRPDGWQRGAAGTQDDEKVPLDYRYGAGELRVDQSFEIMQGGRRANGGRDVGWDFGMARKKAKIYQFASVNSDEAESEPFTAVLAWNRDIKRGLHGAITASLADLDMTLLVKSGRKWKKVARSDSDFDNIETITLNDLQTGTYRLIVRGDRPEPYSIAWFKSEADDHGGGSNSGPGSSNSGPTFPTVMMSGGLSATAVPEPGMMGLALAVVGMMGMRRRR